MGAGLGGRHGDKDSDTDGGSYLAGGVDERASQPLFIVGDARRARHSGGKMLLVVPNPTTSTTRPSHEYRLVAGNRMSTAMPAVGIAVAAIKNRLIPS
jgi:hypothetical protein